MHLLSASIWQNQNASNAIISANKTNPWHSPGNDSLQDLHKQVGKMFQQRNSKTHNNTVVHLLLSVLSHTHAREAGKLLVNALTLNTADKQVCKLMAEERRQRLIPWRDNGRVSGEGRDYMKRRTRERDAKENTKNPKDFILEPLAVYGIMFKYGDRTQTHTHKLKPTVQSAVGQCLWVGLG